MQTKMVYDIYNVTAILEEVAQKAGAKIDDLEIVLESFTTYIKKYNAFRLLNESGGESIDDDLLFENRDFDFKQSYSFCVRYKPKDRLFDVIISDREVILHLKRGFVAPKDSAQIDEFINTIDSIKAQGGVFLRHLDRQREIIMENLCDMPDDEIFITLYRCSHFRQKEGGILEILIDGVNASAKNIIALKECTKIARFTKQKDGHSGRNTFGKYIEVDNDRAESPKYSDDFAIIDDENSIEYLSKKNGFVIFADNAFEFREELRFDNLLRTDNIQFIGDTNTNTKITIGTSGEFSDAIGSGVQVVANEITIYGNIGANSKIIANTLELNGQSHKDSIIITKNAKIDMLKGSIKGDNLIINSVENGIIECNMLEAKQVNGGNLRSQYIHINELYYNANIAFSSKCIIDSLKGGNNKLAFSPYGNIALERKIRLLEMDLHKFEAEAQGVQAKIKGLIYKYNRFAPTAQELKETIQSHRAKNIEPPSYVVENYHYFLEIVKLIKSLKLKNLDLEKAKNETINSIKSLQKEVFEAELICKEGWSKYNDIVFELALPKVHTQKSVIKGVGRYYYEGKKIIHQKIFEVDSK